MHNREVTTKDMVPTPATQGGHVPDIPVSDGALISDDEYSVVGRLDMYRTKVFLYRTMVLTAHLSKVRR